MVRLNLLRHTVPVRYGLAKRILRKANLRSRGMSRSGVSSGMIDRMYDTTRTGRKLKVWGHGRGPTHRMLAALSTSHYPGGGSSGGYAYHFRGMAGMATGRRGAGAFGGIGAFRGMGRGWRKYIKSRRR